MRITFSRTLIKLVALILLIVHLCLPVGPFAQTSVAVAGTPTMWAKWKVEMDFTGGATKAVWTVYVGEYDNSVSPPAMTVTNQLATDLACTPHGNFHIQNGEALFDGRSYLECPVPSFYDAVIKLAGRKASSFDPLLKEQCTCVNPRPWVTADLTLANTPHQNPLVFQVNKDIQFVLATNGANAATSNFALNGTPVPQTFTWPLSTTGNQIWSGYDVASFLLLSDAAGWAKFLSPEFYATAKSLDANLFLHWSNPDQGLKFPFSTQFSATSKATTYLIGYNGHDYLMGKIRKLGFDPGCTPH